jgi:pilus assembly protein CpaF
MPVWAIRKQIASGIDLIIQHDQLTDGTRKITYMTEVVDRLDGEEVVLRDIFRYEIEGIDEKGKVQGRYVAKNVPEFYPMFAKKGVDLSEDIFKE